TPPRGPRDPPALAARALREETARQLSAIEQATSHRVLEELARVGADDTITVGHLTSHRPPDIFRGWDSSETDAGVTKTSYGCDLQFTPAVEGVGEVASVELLIEHFAARSGPLGFYSYLQQHGDEHIEVEATDPGNGTFSAPHCVPERVRVRDLVFLVNSCATAYVDYPGFFDFDLVATTTSRRLEASFLALHVKGFRTASFDALLRHLLADLHLPEAR